MAKITASRLSPLIVKDIRSPKNLGDILSIRVSVKLSFSKDAYFVGAYQKIKVTTRNINFEELDFHIVEGAPAGYISYCRDADFDPANPDIMVCFGYKPGNYNMEVRKKTTNALLGTFPFSVSTDWKDEKNGPQLSFTGICENLGYNPAWGGGPATPQNLNVVPASGTRRIALVLIDCSDARYTTNAATLTAIRKRWMDEAIDGVNNAGRTESARAYYREVSYGNYDLSATAFGPVNLPNAWGTYFGDDGAPTGAFWQQAVTACDTLLNYNDFDNLIFISESFTNAEGTVFNAWPYGGAGNFTTSEGDKNLGVVSMPRQWGSAFRPDRTVRSTIVHELGHSMGLGDQYTPATGRNAGNWEPMNSENRLPHFTLAHRMMLGWVPAGWLKTYNFANGGGVVNETVSLSPIEKGTPAAGKKAGIEIRLADGWNYYVEYRSGQTTHIGDRALDTADAVLVTDVDSTPSDASISRPAIILVSNDVDGDGSVLTNGRNYMETDNTDPTYPTDFKLSVSGITTAKADIKIEYGVNSRPDPSIRPWPASASRQWQSPDIEVQNARNLADPGQWFNVPWSGNPNTVIARVKNNGNLAAPGVRVEFYVKNYTVGGSPETFLGADIRDLPAGGTVAFQAPWNPPADGHHCIIVRIPGYITPGPNPVLEMSVFNNMAQSNYDRFISATASPAERKTTVVEVGNPYEKPTRVYIRPGQSNPLYRTYLEHTSLYLQPGETRKVKMMFEFDPESIYRIPTSLGKTGHTDMLRNKEDRQKIAEVTKKFQPVPNKVGVVAYINNPTEKYPHTPTRMSGVDAEVVTGIRTKFERFMREATMVAGTIVAVDSKQKIAGGKVILTLEWNNGRETRRSNETIDLRGGNSFRHTVPDNKRYRLLSVQAYYLPLPGFGDCYSEKK